MATRKKKTKIERPDRPMLRKHKWREAGWLILEPAKLALAAATFCAGVALLFFVLRQFMGAEVSIADVALGVVKTFVVSYACVGLFVLYLLWVAEKELDRDKPKKERRGLDTQVRREEAPAAAGDAPSQEAAQPTPTELPDMQEILEGLPLAPPSETEDKQ